MSIVLPNKKTRRPRFICLEYHLVQSEFDLSELRDEVRKSYPDYYVDVATMYIGDDFIRNEITVRFSLMLKIRVGGSLCKIIGR